MSSLVDVQVVDEEHSSSSDPTLIDSPSHCLQPSQSIDNEGNETKGVLFTISLPRDILTAYFLLRLKEDIWRKYNMCGKIAIYICLLLPFFIQYMILYSLLQNMNTANIRLNLTGSSVIQNLVALTVLFIYMFKDVIGMYHGLWRYLNHIERIAGAHYNPISRESIQMGKQIIWKRLKNRNVRNDENDRDLDNENFENAGNSDHNMQNTMRNNISIGNNLKFIEFRIWFFVVLLLYAGFAVYSLVQIGTAQTIVTKLGVALGIFFVLELDDWTYELFIAQNGILDDTEFDIQVRQLGVSLDDKINNDQRKLWISLILVFSTIGCVWVISVFM